MREELEDTPVDVLAAERRRLLGVAFRLTGSRADAEDVVHDTYIRWFRLPEEERVAIVNPGAWLTTAASRIALNLLDSARHRREQYVGEWLPEPVPDHDDLLAGDPLDRVTLDDSVSMALLVVLESLTPAERVSFVLHDVFAMPFDEIAAVVGRSSEATRQLATSARRHIRDRRAGAATPAEHTDLVRAFRRAAEEGDLTGLAALLAPDVVSISDGGGRIRAAMRPVLGADRVGRFLLGALSKRPGLRMEERSVNGATGYALVHDAAVVAVMGFAVQDGRISGVYLVMNPDKLTAWTAATEGGIA